MSEKNAITISQIMMPYQANIAGNVHGGEILKIMDNVAGAAAGKYSRSNVVTARVDEVQFLLPIYVGAFLSCTGKVVYVGNSSIEVMVSVDVEDLNTEDEPRKALSAFFTMVALDRSGRPKKVTPLIPGTDEEKELFEIARKKHQDIKIKKKKDYS
ncbi:MAG: acyl-CoA thioesterase [Syntrophomonadaceae bacterium]|nr:acyl-CoA thioesterase [Syntrophomonadaceae bacterium]